MNCEIMTEPPRNPFFGFLSFFFFNVYVFILRERVCVSGRGQRGRERERESQAVFMLGTEPDVGLDFTTMRS